MTQHDVQWLDHRRQPEGQADPAYPRGIDIDISRGADQTCTVMLPYPAQRCGIYLVACQLCGIRVAATTAGRLDDPRSVKMACKRNGCVAPGSAPEHVV